MVIKVVLMLGIAAAALVMLRGYSGARHQAIRRLLLLAFTVAAAASLVAPQVWTEAATLLGVGRGTDLLLYLTILVFLGFVATSYLRFRDMQRQITALTRRLALDEALPPRAALRPAAAQRATARPDAPLEDRREQRPRERQLPTTATTSARTTPTTPTSPPAASAPRTAPAAGRRSGGGHRVQHAAHR